MNTLLELLFLFDNLVTANNRGITDNDNLYFFTIISS